MRLHIAMGIASPVITGTQSSCPIHQAEEAIQLVRLGRGNNTQCTLRRNYIIKYSGCKILSVLRVQEMVNKPPNFTKLLARKPSPSGVGRKGHLQTCLDRTSVLYSFLHINNRYRVPAGNPPLGKTCQVSVSRWSILGAVRSRSSRRLWRHKTICEC
jgi:hypothetical protein